MVFVTIHHKSIPHVPIVENGMASLFPSSMSLIKELLFL